MNITFVVNYCDKDFHLLDKSLENLRKFYPNAKIVSIHDVPHLKTRFDIRFWIERYLRSALLFDFDYVIKVDPDAECRGTLKIEGSPDVFCVKKFYKTKPHGGPVVMEFMPHAGVIGFSKEFVYRMFPLLENPRYINHPFTRDDYQEEIILQDIFKKTNAVVQDRLDFECSIKRSTLPEITFYHY